MRHYKKHNKLNQAVAARQAIVKNLAGSLVIYEKIKTTKAKAKMVKPFVEKLVTIGKINNLTNRRKLLQKLYLKKAVDKILEVLGPRYRQRNGGYIRMVKLDQRKGDGAEMVQIEFIK